jgi:type IV fimbrial biogenesis protein FimT
MVTLTVMGVMLTLAIPGFGNWIQNSRVRSVAEELQNALRLAQAEAVNRNRTVMLVRTAAAPVRNASPSTTGTNWYVQVLPLPSEVGDATFDAAAFVQGGSFSTQSGAGVSGSALYCFNSVGRVIASSSTGVGVDCATPADAATPGEFNVSLSGSNRAMRVELFLGGRVRMCDPLATTGQPNVCVQP